MLHLPSPFITLTRFDFNKKFTFSSQLWFKHEADKMNTYRILTEKSTCSYFFREFLHSSVFSTTNVKVQYF